ncbi:nucleotidyltransferase family protein [Alkalicoccus halolimnae]|uniref:Nucleotidyltransferase family protein n=1 Tax=Alkalicoccus halolimnae TaxID=1667239 RepID=A0A5C7FLR0_9BACI|nr:nucleotidyltransferase family protein [Alkalicoccus halolimnae]TXF87019.1 CBS domain-containing protein [Alkalicoccus halolimnae]
MKKWEQVLAKPDQSIYDVMNIIDRSAAQIALVVDDENKLLGTVTDGDIRRGLLSKIAMDSSIREVMNKSPKTITKNTKESQIYKMLVNEGLKILPIINENNALIDVKTIEDIHPVVERSNSVVLMAGGLGTRLMPLTENTPKPLLKVGDKPILEIIIENFISHNFTNFYISVNYHAEQIKNYFGDGREWGCNIQYIEESKRLGTAGGLSLIPKIHSESMIIMNGDLLTKANFSKLIDFHEEHEATATMCVREYHETIPYGVIQSKNHKFLGVEEKPTFRYLVNAGVYVLSPKAIQYIPDNEFYDMPTLFEKLNEKQKETCVFPIHEYWLDIGQLKDYEKANVEFYEVFE